MVSIGVSSAMGLGLAQRLVGGAAAFSPASLFASGEQGAYFNPLDLSTMRQGDTAGSTAAAVGSPVGYMADQSGNGNHATQSGIKPTLRADGVETTAAMDLPTSLLTGWTSGTLVCAAKLDADPPATAGAAPVGDTGSHGNADLVPWKDDGNVYFGFLSTVRKSCGDPGNMAAWHTEDYRSAANDWRAAFNGTEFYTTVTNTVGVGGFPKIGYTLPTTSLYPGRVGRIIIINRVLNATELANARAWCAAGYGG